MLAYNTLPPLLSARAIETSEIKLNIPYRLLRLKFLIAFKIILLVGGYVCFLLTHIHRIELIALIPIVVLQMTMANLWISVGIKSNM